MTRRQRQDLDEWAPTERTTFTDAETARADRRHQAVAVAEVAQR